MSFSASEGIVSAIRTAAELNDFGKPLDGEWIQTTTPISPGNSGGPLVDLNGRVVGINSFFIIKGQNLNFAVSASDIERIYENTKTSKTLPLAMMVNVDNGVGEKELRSLKLPPKFNYDHKYAVTPAKGKFNNYRTITLGPIELPHEVILFFDALVTDDDRAADNVMLRVNAVATEWRFRKNHTLKFLIDGKITNLGEVAIDYEVMAAGNGVFCIERIVALVPLSLLLSLTRSKSSDIAIGTYEHGIGNSLNEGLRDLLSRLVFCTFCLGVPWWLRRHLQARHPPR